MKFGLIEPRPAAKPLDAKMISYRYWEKFHREELVSIRTRIENVLADIDRQHDLFVEAAAAPAPVAPKEVANATLGVILSPSQVNTFLNCSAKWWFKYGLGHADPTSGSAARGRTIHRMVEAYYRAKKAGAAPEPDDLADTFEAAWEEESGKASFQEGDNLEELKRQAAVLTRKYLDEVAIEIQPAEMELRVAGEIGGVPVQGYVDLLDVDGRIIDVKAKGQTPSRIESDYALQIATYGQLAPGANGQARLDVLVPNKTPKLVTFPHTVSAADQVLTQHLYPHVREGIREGLYFPNRTSHLCSRKYCNFADACEKEFGGTVE